MWLLGGVSGQEPSVAPAPSTTAPSAAAPSTTRAAPTTTTTATAAPQPQPAADPVDFLEQYYALLPSDTDAAWELLSPQAQSASGGRASFENFYRRFEDVDLQDARQTGDGTAEATIVFDPRNGETTRERFRFVIGDEDGEPIMESFSRQVG